MKVILGICGSIAAYKALELISLLKKDGHEVKTILTKSALNFVTPLSCQTLGDNEVYLEQFVLTSGIKHLTISEWGDILVIAPATANIIGKAASGIGDDLLSTTMLSFPKPILFIPAMAQEMWQNKIVMANVQFLKENGYHLLEPVTGLLASGKIGKGRLPPVALIYKKILTTFQRCKSLQGKKFLITGGRTEEDFDPVRVITNRSSGKMALELLEAVICRAGKAKGIMAETSVQIPEGVDVLRARTSAEMLEALKENIAWCDYLIMAAAIGDYRPLSKSKTKIHANRMKIELAKNRDLLKELAKEKKEKIFVGFSLEDKAGIDRAKEKLPQKGLDFIILNSPKALGKERTEARLLKKNGEIIQFGKLSKWELANRILDECLELKGEGQRAKGKGQNVKKK